MVIQDRALEGQVHIVTGAARAIGAEIAVTLGRRGATVVSFDLADAGDTVSGVEKAGGHAEAHTVDVTDEAAVDRAVAGVLGAHGRIDGLVNNAGLFAGIERRPFWEIDLAEWDRVNRVNINSVFLCSRAVADPMRHAGRGRIVNIASNVITFGMPNLLHYCGSKGAVVAMTRSMARELGPYGVGVNAVGPGLVTTEVTSELIPEEYRRQVAEGQCLQRALTPPDIAEAVSYLCGPEAAMITGQTLLVNGGASMGPV